MLQLILGKSGSGKTFTLIERIAKLLESDQEAEPILLVPEQFSFETEKILLERLGAKDAIRVKTFSFTRLSEIVLRDSGKIPQKPLDEGTRLLLLDQAFKARKDEMQALHYRKGNAGQLALLMDTLKEWKQNDVSEETLSDLLSRMPADSALKKKLADFGKVKETFEAYVSGRFDDPQDLLMQACEALRAEGTRLADTRVFLDGFMGFTVPEEKLLSLLLSRAAEVTVTLCTNDLSASPEQMGLFSLPTETANRLIRLADEMGVTKNVLHLDEDHRHNSEALQTLCSGLFCPDEDKFEETTNAVTVLSCADKNEECKAAAREIRFAMRDGKKRCREIAVVVRDVGEYRSSLEMALQSEGIPFYVDARESIRKDALAETLCAALRVVCYRFRTEDILRLLKTGLLSFSVMEIATLENYVYQWSLKNDAWKSPFIHNPDGLNREMNQKQLDYLNDLRERIMTPLQALDKRLAGEVDGETFATALYTYLMDISAAECVRRRVADLENNGHPALADFTERAWEEMMQLLDTFAKGGEQRQAVTAWMDLFTLTVEKTELGLLPKGLDAVQIGAADRSRLSEPSLVFILGANDGAFPAVPSSGGYLSARERKLLSEQYGFTLSRDLERELTEERLYAYNAVAAAKEKVVITYARSSMQGEPLSPSLLVSEVKRILPQHRHETFRTDVNWMPETAEEAMSYYTATWSEPTVLTAAVRAQLKTDPMQQRRLEALERAANQQAWEIESPDITKMLFGGDMTLSATKVDTYYCCPFRYFCRYGLHVNPLKKADVDKTAMGNIVHAVLETLVPLYQREGFEHITPVRIKTDVTDTVNRYIEREMGGFSDKSVRFSQSVERTIRMSKEVLCHLVEELAQSGFVPREYELEIGNQEGKFPSTTLVLNDGSKVSFEGKIDRVDVFEQGEITYIRVVDYKTGPKEFRLDDVLNGINLQMLLYLFSLCENPTKEYSHPHPAGVLYMPAGVTRFSAQLSTEQLQIEKNKAMKMQGLVLDDEDVLREMDKDIGTYIPAKLSKSGFTHYSSVSSEEGFRLLSRRSKELLAQMATNLHEGNIEARPSEVDSFCERCDYHAVCGFDKYGEKRPFDYLPPEIRKANKRDILALAVEYEREKAAREEQSSEENTPAE